MMDGPDRNLSISPQQKEQLKLLSLFHYVVALLVGVLSLTPIFHFFFGVFMIIGSGNFESQSGVSGETPPDFMVQGMGWLFAIISGAIILLGLAMAVLIVIAGRRISQCRSLLFCQIVAGIQCLFFPFGTVLGVFTLIILNKSEMAEAFRRGS